MPTINAHPVPMHGDDIIDIVTNGGLRWRVEVHGEGLTVRQPDGRPVVITPEVSNVVHIGATTFRVRDEVFGV